ncbi:MAG: hypothetical protein LUE21_04830 [Oscillospiraceae bacterium]|nr:hypothetical protein [Oscillospiraceae bacterium]
MTEQEQQALQKKYFPHTPWTEEGPVRRRYMALAEGGDAAAALTALAEAELLLPGEQVAAAGGEEALALFRRREAGEPLALILGLDLQAHWCDIALSAPDAEGWQTLLVRSETGENLIALAHARKALRLRRG